MKFVNRFLSINGITSALYHSDTMELEVRHRKGIDRFWLRIMIASKIDEANLHSSVNRVTLMVVLGVEPKAKEEK
jgi:hypothetical protein